MSNAVSNRVETKKMIGTMSPIKRFIIIDDDPLSNMICKLTLELALGNPNVEVFTSAEQGLFHISSLSANALVEPTILLLDINMPVMSGWEFLSRFDDLVETIKSKIKVYILSSSVDPRDRERSYSNVNVKNHFVKPLTIEVIGVIVVTA
jgi:CheY-like chemotaxis protein